MKKFSPILVSLIITVIGAVGFGIIDFGKIVFGAIVFVSTVFVCFAFGVMKFGYLAIWRKVTRPEYILVKHSVRVLRVLFCVTWEHDK